MEKILVCTHRIHKKVTRIAWSFMGVLLLIAVVSSFFTNNAPFLDNLLVGLFVLTVFMALWFVWEKAHAILARFMFKGIKK